MAMNHGSFEYDPFTKRQNLEWKSALSPRPKKVRIFKSKTEVMLIAFFDVHEIVHAEFLPQGQTINQHIYKNTLRHLMHSVREKRRELCRVATSWKSPGFFCCPGKSLNFV